MFAGAWWDGVYASVDGGETWQARDAGIDVRSLFSLAATEIEGSTRLFAGTEPAHLYYSDDMGMSWAELPEVRSVESLPRWRFAADPFEAHLKHINFHPDDPTHMYVCIEVGGLLESTDGGRTWADIDVPNPDVHRTVIDYRNPSVLRTTGGAGLLLTEDGGQSWQELFGKENEIGGYPDQLVHLPSDPDTLYISASQTGPRSWVREGSTDGFAGGRIARSTDGGTLLGSAGRRVARPVAWQRRSDVPRRVARERSAIRRHDRRRSLVDGRRRRELEPYRATRPGIQVGAHRDVDRRTHARPQVLRRERVEKA